MFRVDSSNMVQTRLTPSEYDQNSLINYSNAVKSDRTGMDLLIQSMLQLGILLSAKIVEEEIDGKRVFSVQDDYLIACFEEGIENETVEQIALRKPAYAVFLDSGIKDDATLANIDQIFERISPETQRRRI